MAPIDELRGILEAARGKALTTDVVETLVRAYERHDKLLKRLTEDNRALKDAVDLYRMKAAHLEAQLHSLRKEHAQVAVAEVPLGLPAGYKPSADARRVLAGLAAQKRSEFWSSETRALSPGLGLADLEVAINELLDHDLIEELSYTALEGTHYGCTARGKELMNTLFEMGR